MYTSASAASRNIEGVNRARRQLVILNDEAGRASQLLSRSATRARNPCLMPSMSPHLPSPGMEPGIAAKTRSGAPPPAAGSVC